MIHSFHYEKLIFRPLTLLGMQGVPREGIFNLKKDNSFELRR